MPNTFTAFEKGTIACKNADIDAATLPWNPHPSFPGVKLKHLVTGEETKGAFSVHLVNLDANAEIGQHDHENSWELHEIVDGSGYCVLDDKKIMYTPGVAAVLPKGMIHRVQANEGGLQIMAKFIPALL